MKSVTTKPESGIRILKTSSCPSVSGKSTLMYHVGCKPDADIQFCVSANTGGGAFSEEWISLKAIQEAFAKAASEKAITAFLLYPLFQSKSVNTPSFLLAALKNEGLVRPSTTRRRCQELTDPAQFLAEISALIAAGGEPKVVDITIKEKGKSTKVSSKSKSAKASRKPKSAEVKPDMQVAPKVEPMSEPQQGVEDAIERGDEK